MSYTTFSNAIEVYFDNYLWNKEGLKEVLKEAWDIALQNYSDSKLKYHKVDGEVSLDWNNLDQSVYLLYFSSHFAYRMGNHQMAGKLYRLNRMLNAVDIFYEVELPIHTMFIHPVGTVLGKAEYKDYLVVYQGVTVGSDLNGNFPKLRGKNVLFSNSSLLANSILGINSGLSARSVSYNLHIDDNHYLRTDGKINVLKPEITLIENYYFD